MLGSYAESLAVSQHRRPRRDASLRGMTIHPNPVSHSASPEPGTRLSLAETVAAVLCAMGADGLAQDPILTREQVAKMLGISVSTLLRMARREEGPKITRLSPRRLGYRLADVNAWAEAQRAGQDD